MTHERAIYILKNTAWLGTVNDLAQVEMAIRTLEDAEPRRRGLWIFETNAFITKDGSQFAGYKCSECGNTVWHGGNYCPNCGSQMEGQE